MKTLPSSRRLFALALLVLLATNLVVLLGVASNRRGEPEARLTLTERELPFYYPVQKENSGMTLRLAWRAQERDEEDVYYPYGRSPAWLNAAKLRELGFRIDVGPGRESKSTHYKEPIPKEVLIVLEKGGEPHEEAIRRAEAALAFARETTESHSEDIVRAERRVERESIAESRLFAVDAGLDRETLREKYKDRTSFIIAKGLIEPLPLYDEGRKVFGYITRLSMETIHVPLKHRRALDAILTKSRSADDTPAPPRYEVELAYGRRLEPWILSIHPLGKK